MAELLAGLVGVLVGGAITWGLEVYRARRVDSDETRVAARLVADELRSIENLRTVDEPQLRKTRELARAQDAWISHRAVLARELSDNGWRAVLAAYDALATPQRSVSGEAYVDERYAGAMQALGPLTTSRGRYWWQRIIRRSGT